MQHILTLSIEAIALLFPFYIAIQFLSYLKVHNHKPQLQEIDMAPGGDEDLEDLLSIESKAEWIDLRWLHTMSCNGLRASGQLETIPGASRWNKRKAIATLTAHFA